MSHLDLLRTMERVFRRAGLPLAFSEGFNPHPKVSFGSALAVGVTSEGEYMDVELREYLPLSSIKERLISSLPSGIQILEIIELEKRGQSLTAQINMARYRVIVPLISLIEIGKLQDFIKSAMDQTSFFITRYGKKGKKQVDIKKGIYELEGKVNEDKLLLQMDLQTGSEGNVRPEEVVEMLKEMGNLSLREGMEIHRLGLYIREEKVIKSPLG